MTYVRKPSGRYLVAASTVLMMGAESAPRFPEELRGTWDLGPSACTLPVNPDSDTPIHIDSRKLASSESIDLPRRIIRVSDSPNVWVVTLESNAAPGVVYDEVFVLRDDYLTVTTGETSRAYRRCR
jgi:hypothetical protein